MPLEMTEKQLLATFIMEPSTICRDIDDLFAVGEDRDIYTAIMNVMDNGGKVHAVSVAEAMTGKTAAPFTKIGAVLDYLGHAKLAFLADDARDCIRSLRQERARTMILAEAQSQFVDFAGLRETVNAADTGVQSATGITSTQGIEALRADMILPESEKIYSGFPTIDHAMRGWRKGETAMFMGRTTTGKTWIALTILRQMMIRKQRVSFFSLEGAPARISERMLQVYEDTTHEFIEGLLDDSAKMNKYAQDMAKVSFHHRIVSPRDIEESIDKEGPDVVIVDFLGLLKSDVKGSPYEQASDTVKALKSIAVDKNVFMFYTHQLSRRAEDGSVPVKLSDARDSGQIEELTDYIVGLWRPGLHSEIPRERYGLKMEILKNKSGDTTFLEAHLTPSGRVIEVEKEGFR